MHTLTITIEAPCRTDCLAVVAGIAQGLDAEVIAGLIAAERGEHDASVGTQWQGLDGAWTTLHNDVTWTHEWVACSHADNDAALAVMDQIAKGETE